MKLLRSRIHYESFLSMLFTLRYSPS